MRDGLPRVDVGSNAEDGEKELGGGIEQPPAPIPSPSKIREPHIK